MRVKELYKRYISETGFIEEELEERFTFNEGNDGKTVNISSVAKNDTAEIVPKAVFVENSNDSDYGNVTDKNYDLSFKENEEMEKILEEYSKLKEFNKDVAEIQVKRVKLLNKKIKQLYKKELKADDPVSKEIVNRSFITDNDSVFFKPIGEKGNYLAKKLILKKGKGTNLVFSSDKANEKAVSQFKELVSKLSDTKKKEKPIEKEEEIANVVDVNRNADNYEDIPGLTHEENREQKEVVHPSETIDLKSRIGEDGFLQVQADHYQKTIDKTEKN